MKTLTILAAVLALSIGAASAQDVTGFDAPKSTTQPGKSTIKPQPKPNPDLTPKPGGVFTALATKGAVMVSPGAPASYGMGEKYLSAPSQSPVKGDLQHEAGFAKRRDTGGFKLFSWEF